MTSTRAAELIEQLRTEAGPRESGEFSIAEEAAAAKLAAFRYHDARAYLVPLVEGLRALGATSIRIVPEGGDLRVEANEVDVDDARAALSRLFASVVARRPDLTTFGLGRMGVAVDMALSAADVQRVAAEMLGGSNRAMAVWTRGDAGPELELRTLPSLDDPGPVRLRVWFDWTATVEVARMIPGVATHEREALATALAADPMVVPIRWRNELLSTPEPTLISPSGSSAEAAGDGFRVRVGRVDETACAGVMFRSEGMVLERLDPIYPGTLCLIDLDRPDRDLSQQRLTHDERYIAALERAEELARRVPAAPPRGSDPVPEARRPLAALATGSIVAVAATAMWFAGMLTDGYDELEKVVERRGRERVEAVVIGEGAVRYSFEGEEYTPHHERWKLKWLSHEGARLGTRVRVWIDPAAPADPRLDTPVRADRLRTFAASVTILAGIGYAVLRRRRTPAVLAVGMLVAAAIAGYLLRA
jgi:hypothetical protein